jgi:hypothetical protein
MFNLNTSKYVYKGNCPDRRDPLNPKKRFEFDIDAKTFLPSEKLENPPIGQGYRIWASSWERNWLFQAARLILSRMLAL